MRLVVIALLLSVAPSCKRSTPSASEAGAGSPGPRASVEPAASASAPPAKSNAPPDEIHWLGELPPGPIERRVCFASTKPPRPMAEAAVDPQSFLFLARVVAQGWTAKPSPTRKRVGSIYLSIIDSMRGDSLLPGAVIALPIDDPPCTDAGPCGFDWSLSGPGATVVVGCSPTRPHVPYENAVLDVAGPRAVAVEELRRCVALSKAAKAGVVLERPDGGLALDCVAAIRRRSAPDAGAATPKAPARKP